MVVSYHRPTKAIIHTKAITENVRQETARLKKGTELFAVVKANGYGHGAVQTALAAVKGGAAGFCVSNIDEAIQLRDAGLTQPILILGVVAIAELPLISDYQIAIPISSLEWLREAAEYLAQHPLTHAISVHLKIDTGMGRIGFTTSEETLQAAKEIEDQPAFCWEGIFTHFATADQADDSYWQAQKQRFAAILQALPKRPRYVHISNSATALWHEDDLGNMVRYGVAMYGLNPSGHALPETYPLKPALELVSEIIHVKKAAAGSGIGYGKTYTTPDAEWIATVPIGYADGWLRKLQGFSVLVEGQYCEIVGRVCMDQIMLRLPSYFPLGTKVTLIGENNGQTIRLQDIADQLGTIHYEVACTLSERIPREYQA